MRGAGPPRWLGALGCLIAPFLLLISAPFWIAFAVKSSIGSRRLAPYGFRGAIEVEADGTRSYVGLEEPGLLEVPPLATPTEVDLRSKGLPPVARAIAEAARQSDESRVRIVSADPQKLQAIKLLRETTKLGLEDSKDAVEGGDELPATSGYRAHALVAMLGALGARAEAHPAATRSAGTIAG